jgi:hypothetical protein
LPLLSTTNSLALLYVYAGSSACAWGCFNRFQIKDDVFARSMNPLDSLALKGRGDYVSRRLEWLFA